MSFEAALFLENGTLFKGEGFGANVPSGGEVVFNTGMTGYQEIFSDPSYCQQIVVMTYPHIGNTGINDEDGESQEVFLKGVVAREYCEVPSSWRSTKTLSAYLEKSGVPLLSGIDTRRLTQIIRDEGAQRGVVFPITSKDAVAEGKKHLEKVPSMEGLGLVSQVSCKEPYLFTPTKRFEKMPDRRPELGHIVAYDFGTKAGILNHFYARGFDIEVVPFGFSHKETLSRKPKAVVLSNGPGDPASVSDSVEEIKELIGKVPIFAVCMGHQLLARAVGATTFKLKFGHHGVNHPVKDLRTGRILVTSQNHGFSVDPATLPKSVTLTHTSLNDGTVEGYQSEKEKFLSVQFHPESAPGPRDGSTLFDSFIKGYLQ